MVAIVTRRLLAFGWLLAGCTGVNKMVKVIRIYDMIKMIGILSALVWMGFLSIILNI